MFIEANTEINTIPLSDLSGREIMPVSNVNAIKTCINIGSLSNGAYLLKITDGTHATETKHLIKQ